MNLLLTHGYYLNEDIKEQEIMRPYPPLGILYISAYLEAHGVEHEVFDSTFSTSEKFASYLTDNQPSVVAFYTNLMTKLNVLKWINFIKQNAQLNQTKIILGGPDITYNIEDYLNCGADFLIIGEGEETTLELVKELQSGSEDFCEINGLAFKGENGQIVTNKPRTKIKQIDDLPIPNRSKINLQAYLDTWKKHHGQSALSVSTQRGCPYTCQWCSTAVYGQSYRRRKPAAVVQELKELKALYNPDTIWFVDDVFTVSHVWLKELLHELQQHQFTIPFECITRADRLNEEVMQMLKEAGCFRIWIGAESGSQNIIDKMDRRVDVHQVRNMIQLANQYGIESGTFIMLGYPGEDELDIKETVHHLKASNPDHFTITITYPIKGTGLFNEVKSMQTKKLDWSKTTDRDRDFKRTYPRKYYDFAVRYVVNEVKLHQVKNSASPFRLDRWKFGLKSGMARAGMLLNRK